MNLKHSMADILKAEVIYQGVNPVGSHQWSNGSVLVTDLTPTIDEAIAHWGDRINTRARYYTQSSPFREGRESKTYAPRPGAGRQEKLEYGLGYIQGRLDEMKKAKTVAEIEKKAAPAAAPAPKIEQSAPEEIIEDIPPTEPAVVMPTKAALSQSIANIAKRRGRPPKAQ